MNSYIRNKNNVQAIRCDFPHQVAKPGLEECGQNARQAPGLKYLVAYIFNSH